MENASKALLIAGGVLLVMLIVGLLLFAWGRFGEFYSKKDDLAEITDVSEFNLQFTNYDREDVHGYELISLANKIADYNMKYSSLADAKNDQKYNPITMKFSMTSEEAESFQFSKEIPDSSGKVRKTSLRDRLFKKTLYTQSISSNEIIGQIFDPATKIEDIYGGASSATKLAKSINNLILSEEQLNYNRDNRHLSYTQSKANALITYNNLASKDNKIDFDDKNETSINEAYRNMIDNKLLKDADIMKYYEYYQFKRGIFKCDSTKPIKYDNITGRVSEINFIFTGSIE